MTASYLFGFLGLALFGKTVQFLLTEKRQKETDPNEKCDKPTMNEVLFFPDARMPCSDIVNKLTRSPADAAPQSCGNMSCRKLHNRPGEASSMIRFLGHLAKAQHSVDLCIYLFTQAQLADVLCDLQRTRGIAIRVITDSTEDDGTASQIRRLRSHKIVVKSNKRGTGALMHHKFVIVDGKVLLTGSFNWTNKAVVSNHEAVLVTTEPNLVQPFCVKFDEMWSQFGLHPTK